MWGVCAQLPHSSCSLCDQEQREAHLGGPGAPFTEQAAQKTMKINKSLFKSQVVHACQPSIREAEIGGSMGLSRRTT